MLRLLATIPVRRFHVRWFACLVSVWFHSGLVFADLTVESPLEYQVLQRDGRGEAELRVRARWEGGIPPAGEWRGQVRVIAEGEPKIGWTDLAALGAGGVVSGRLSVPAGGWYRVEVRLVDPAGQVIAAPSAVEHVGVGEVFVVAGQSNSANHGEERLSTETGRVAAFDGTRWRLARDPQPGASGSGGSFMPPFGDAVVRQLGVPVGFVACGLGGTSVREWLPRGVSFPHPPTVEARVSRRSDGAWESDGAAFEMLVRVQRGLGVRGFRAVLWHQGESDANQRDPSRTLPGSLYEDFLGRVIRESRARVGWEVPWFVAQVSYHVPGDESSPEIRAAQRAVVERGLALAGPDSDSLGSRFRDGGGQGVHFSGTGLRELARLWAERVLPWLETRSGSEP